jgi:hypothetical protein
MAYIGSDGYLAAWVAGALKEDILAECCIHLLESRDGVEGSDQEGADNEPSRGFIISDWFGPFLLGPTSRFLRGRC